MKSGRPVLDPAKQTGASKGNVKDICPSLEGGVSPASPGAYSPHTGLFYTSTNNLCMDFEATRTTRLRGVPYMGAGLAVPRRPGWPHGRFHGVGCGHG